MAVRNIRVIGDRMEPRRIYAGTRGSYITEVAFTFSGEWDGLTKKLIFYPVRGKPVYINYTYGSEKIPYEVMRYSGDAIMLMSGYSVEPDGSLGVKIVTASAFVAVDPAESDTQNEPDIPEATEFEKIVAKLGAPYIGESGNWFVWDVYTHEFADTGLPARGEKGETGRGLTILGKYGSLVDLRESVKDAQPGDAYAVGEKAPYTIYIWDEVTGDFTNHGDLRGVGITKIEQITDNTGSGEPNTIRIVTDDGAEYDYTVYNGERGHPGNIWIGETEPPDDSYTIWLNPGGAVSGFVESYQGTENAGHALVVGDDGIVRPGEYAGDGGRGAMILNVTSWPLVYTTETNSLIKYRSPISTVLAQSGASDVKAGDIVWCGTYHYSVLSTDDTYAYMGAYTFIQGAPGKSAYAYAKDGGYTGTEKEFSDDLSGIAGKITAPATASVGQTIKVSAVDDNGKPTAWEAADFPEGGGAGVKRAARVVTTENATSLAVTGLSVKLPVTIALYNTGKTTLGGAKLTVNGITKNMFGGTLTIDKANRPGVLFWLVETETATMNWYALMSNQGWDIIDFGKAPETINSIAVESYYANDGETTYLQSGTIIEIYEGVFPNVK